MNGNTSTFNEWFTNVLPLLKIKCRDRHEQRVVLFHEEEPMPRYFLEKTNIINWLESKDEEVDQTLCKS